MGLLIINYLIGHRLEALLLLEISHVFSLAPAEVEFLLNSPAPISLILFFWFVVVLFCLFWRRFLHWGSAHCLPGWDCCPWGEAIVMGLCLVCDNGYHPQKYQEPSVLTEHWVTKKWQALFTSLDCLAWSHKWQNNKKTNETSLLQQT